MKAQGTNARFEHTESSTSHRDAIWTLWTTPSEWGRWDGGLKSAEMDGAFAVGSAGHITPHSGPKAAFVVTELAPGQRYVYETTLPLARLRIERLFEREPTTTFTHRVSFHGVLGWLWAAIMGPQFREELPHTMKRLASLAASSSRED